jgi:SOS-response transcriptional repressor LexA
MLNEILERIHTRLEKLGLEAAKASAMAGLSKDAIRNIERAVKAGKEDAGTSTSTIMALAPVLKTTASWLLEATGPEESADAPPRVRIVPVAAYIQAGAWNETWEWEDGAQYSVAIPDDEAFRGLKLYAAEARGTSMNRRWSEGTVLVFTNAYETQESPIPGKRYIVERKRASGEAEHTVKLLHKDADGKFWLMPESDDPRHQAPISVDEGTGDEDTVTIIGRVVYAVARE